MGSVRNAASPAHPAAREIMQSVTTNNIITIARAPEQLSGRTFEVKVTMFAARSANSARLCAVVRVDHQQHSTPAAAGGQAPRDGLSKAARQIAFR